MSAPGRADNRNLSAPAESDIVVRTNDPLAATTDAFIVKLRGSHFEAFLADMLNGRFASLPDALRVKENALALKHLLSARVEAKKLARIDRIDADRAPGSWDRWPAAVASTIAAELGVADQAKVREVLHHHVRVRLTSLNVTPEDVADPRLRPC